MSEPLRVGILGSGRWANVHRETLAAAGAELAGVLTGRSERAREVELEWGVAATTDLATLLAMDLEAVIVSTPNDLHAPQALAAIAAGKHVLIEKPMANRFTSNSTSGGAPTARARVGGRATPRGSAPASSRSRCTTSTWHAGGSVRRPR